MNVRSMSGSTGTQALILAGGRGERLYPLTAFRPKPAIPFGGVFRIVDFTLSNCLNSKLDRVALLTQYRHEVLNDYIRQRWSELWKTGGKDSHQLVCLAPAAGRRYRGTADAVFQNLVENCQSAVGYDFGHNIIPALIDSARVYAYDFRDEMKGEPRYWRDIGTIDSYHDASMDLVRPEPLFNPYRENRWHSGPTSFHNDPQVWGGAHVALSVLSPGRHLER